MLAVVLEAEAPGFADEAAFFGISKSAPRAADAAAFVVAFFVKFLGSYRIACGAGLEGSAGVETDGD